MTHFEFALVIIYCLFAWIYVTHAFGIDNNEKWWTRLLTIIFAIIPGIIYFPMIIAEDIWKKLNKK